MAITYTERARRQVNKLPEDVRSSMCSGCVRDGNSAACRECRSFIASQIAEGAPGNLLNCPAKLTVSRKLRQCR